MDIKSISLGVLGGAITITSVGLMAMAGGSILEKGALFYRNSQCLDEVAMQSLVCKAAYGVERFGDTMYGVGVIAAGVIPYTFMKIFTKVAPPAIKGVGNGMGQVVSFCKEPVQKFASAGLKMTASGISSAVSNIPWILGESKTLVTTVAWPVIYSVGSTLAIGVGSGIDLLTDKSIALLEVGIDSAWFVGSSFYSVTAATHQFFSDWNVYGNIWWAGSGLGNLGLLAANQTANIVSSAIDWTAKPAFEAGLGLANKTIVHVVIPPFQKTAEFAACKWNDGSILGCLGFA